MPPGLPMWPPHIGDPDICQDVIADTPMRSSDRMIVTPPRLYAARAATHLRHRHQPGRDRDLADAVVRQDDDLAVTGYAKGMPGTKRINFVASGRGRRLYLTDPSY